jgi:transposase InsO family protein
VTAIGQAGDGDASFYGKPRNELLNGEILYTLRGAQVLIENWRQHYNRIRPHSALGYRPPAPETTLVRLTAESRIGETRNAA